MKMENISNDMRQCIELCLQCYQTCLSTATMHCLPEGGKHAEPNHIRLMLCCAEICRTAAHIMLTGSPLHGAVCSACAKMCLACAENCMQVGEMDECVDICQRCQKSCQDMAQHFELPANVKQTMKNELPTPA